MKKKIGFIFAVAIILIIATFTYLHFVGNTYTKSIAMPVEELSNYNYENLNITYSDDTIVENTERKIENNSMILSFKGLKKGTTEVKIKYIVNNEQEEEVIPITTGFLGIVYGYNDLSDFCGGESVIVALIIFMALIVSITLITIIKDVRTAKYSYSFINNIALFIVSMSIMIIGINEFVSFLNTPYNDYRGLYLLYQSLVSGIGAPAFFLFPVFFIFSISMIISNISLIKHEGKGLANMLGIIISLMIVGGYIILFITDKGNNNKIHILLSNIYDSAFYFCESIFIGTVIAGIAAAKHKAKYNKDFIIINGCGIGKDGKLLPLLQGRVDKAIEFYNEQKEKAGKEAIIIPSGGQGSDECISEAQAMKNYLTINGIPEKNIIMEDKSTTTFENMKYSKNVIDKIKKDSKVAFVTTNYHVFRAGIYATEVGLDAKGIGSKTKWYFWPNAFIREFIGMLEHYKIKLILELGLLILFMFILQTLVLG